MEVWVVMRDEDGWDMVLGVYATRASADARTYGALATRSESPAPSNGG